MNENNNSNNLSDVKTLKEVSSKSLNNNEHSNNENIKPLINRRALDEITYPKSSLSLLIINYYSFLYSVFYLVANSLLFVYKGFVLPYPPQSLGPEIAGFYFFITIQLFRHSLNNTGNKTETISTLCLSLALCIPVIMGFVYLLRLQTYSLVFDLVMNIIGIIFVGMEIINIIVAILKFISK